MQREVEVHQDIERPHGVREAGGIGAGGQAGDAFLQVVRQLRYHLAEVIGAFPVLQGVDPFDDFGRGHRLELFDGHGHVEVLQSLEDAAYLLALGLALALLGIMLFLLAGELAGEPHQLIEAAFFFFFRHVRPLTLTGEPGFEPGLRDPKSPVLPLHHSPMLQAGL
jgi:hypothetical protein